MGAGLSANAKQALANCKKEGKTELNFSSCNIRKVKNFRPLLKLKNLTYLNLEHNLIEELPNNMEKLKFLRHINLKDNQLTVMAPAFLVMSELTKLNLGMNKLTELAEPISNLRGLTWLDISYNTIRNLPADFKDLPLKHLNFSGNKNKVLPPVVWELSNLEELYVHHNALTVLRPEVKKLAKLRTLDMSFNELEELSGVVGSLADLKQLYVNDNRLKELPAELTQLGGLEVLSAGYNQLVNLDTLEEGFRSFEGLLELLLSNNKLTSLPPDIGHLPKLKVIDISNNQLEILPKQIGWLDKSLRRLLAANNRIKQLPGDLSFLNPALKLDLSGNPLDTDLKFQYDKGTAVLLDSLSALVRAYPEHCVAYGDALVAGVAGKGESFKVKAFDKFKKEVKGSKDNFTAIMTLQGDDGNPVGEPYECHIKNLKNGEHQVFYNLRKSGFYKTRIQNDGSDILGSPFDTAIEPGPPSYETSTAAGKGLINQPAGSSVSFSIITRDKFSNPITQGGAEITVKIDGGSAPQANVVDHGDGSYTVSYVLGWAGTYVVYVSIDGRELLDSPYKIEAYE